MNFYEYIISFFEYIGANYEQILKLLIEHIKLTTLSVGFAILIGVPLGILICYIKKLNKPVLGIANVMQAIPSMALLGFAIPILGIGTLPAIVTVVLYSLLPIIKNTCTGINSIPAETLEAAKGIGLTKFQILFKVQIPLALPIIMSGVRISAVTAVGLMTIAAFIGAGGLGYLVFSGIRTVNNNQILAGAIPACLLALGVDFLAGIVEKLVTPISLQKTSQSKKSKKHYKMLLSGVAVVLIGILATSAILEPKVGNRVIRIGTKDFSEQMLLGHMMADLIEDRTDIQVERKINLGGTQVCFSAMKNDDIDMYIEYSGTAYGDILGYSPISDVDEVYTTVKNKFKELYDIDVLHQMAFNNTYTLAVTKETADKYNLKTMSDLTKAGRGLVAGTTLEFLNREDGMVGLTKKYNLKFKDSIGLDGSPRYVALMNKEVDVVDAFLTDGLLEKFDLVVLEDDKNFFPPYYAIPIIREDVVEKYPEIVEILNELGNYLDNETMTELNYKVDELQLEPELVAREFLQEKGLID